MPRLSADARAAAAFRAGGRLPPAPKGLSRRAKAIWCEIVRSKPLDWFDPGSLGLLARYCTLLAYAEAIERDLAAFADGQGPAPADGEVFATVAAAAAEARKTSATLTTLATKLRLSVQASVRRDNGLLSEKGPASSPLLGGAAVLRFPSPEEGDA